jgi:tRNA (guanine37-N1)-methyltransferase
MRFDVLTLFPELFAAHMQHGITRRAYERGVVQVELWQLRDFALDTYKRVDDRPYGGGPGMVMLAEPLERAFYAVQQARQVAGLPTVLVHFSPAGRPLNQAMVQTMAEGEGAVLLCGRYEGVDQRFLDRHQAIEISLGDFVLSGGELPALALLDAVARLQPGVLSTPSHQQDSFSHGLLEGPQYSRPEVWPVGAGDEGRVPGVLLGGHHQRIERWQREQALAQTARRRPELILAAREAGRLTVQDEAFLRNLDL